MDATKFWRIVGAGSKLDDPDEQLEAIEEKLSAIKPEELITFDELLDDCVIKAYTQDVWGAAYLMNGGCSDDGFLYFRLWLVARGKKVFDAALANADSLASQADPDRDDLGLEELMYLAPQLYEQALGTEMPRTKREWPELPTGEAWDYDDDAEVKRRLPKLAAIYLQDE